MGLDDVQKGGNARKKKQKFVNILSETGQSQIGVITLPGRHLCDCEARRHALVNNCISCGKIVCEQEGAGPCFFCNHLVCTNEQMDVINTGSRKGEELKRKLMAGISDDINSCSEGVKAPLSLSSISKSLDKAIADKNRLVLADKNESLTRVIDDQSDYFSSDYNPFMSKEERVAIAKRKEELLQLQNNLKKANNITLDFAGRRVLHASNDYDFSTDPVLQEIYGNSESGPVSNTGHIPGHIIDNIKYDVSVGVHFPPMIESWRKTSTRLQDCANSSVSLPNMALSMHQPYASLLIKGIKRHEGRNWYTTHRGRLWIAATSKPIDKEEGAQIEHFYKQLNKGHIPPHLPQFYPCSVLLGCVNVSDCLSQEEYQEKYPGGESQSPYVFICDNPIELTVKFPVQGQHKIYPLDSAIYKAAMKSLGGRCH